MKADENFLNINVNFVPWTTIYIATINNFFYNIYTL